MFAILPEGIALIRFCFSFNQITSAYLPVFLKYQLHFSGLHSLSGVTQLNGVQHLGHVIGPTLSCFVNRNAHSECIKLEEEATRKERRGTHDATEAGSALEV